MRLAFMGTPMFALPSLSELIHAQEHNLQCVITQADKPRGRGMLTQSPPVKEMALHNGLYVYQPLVLKNNDEFYDLITKGDFDAVIVVAYGKMIPADLLSIPKFGFINVHASLLPEFRGSSPINRAIMAGRKTTGVSIMQIEAGMDSGPVFLQAQTDIKDADNAVSLTDRLSKLGAEKLMETLSLIEQGKIEPTPQDHAQATYAPMLTKEDGEIDWSQDPVGIYNKIRGLVPWPCAYTYMNGKMLKILSASFELGEQGIEKGTFIKDRMGLKISCKGGFIIPHTVQLEGKKVLDSLSFSRGLKSEQLMVGR
jgi:methionyl-tRNA formyltransferase